MACRWVRWQPGQSAARLAVANLIGCLVGCCLASAPATAETITEAMAAAWDQHPALMAERAREGAARTAIEIARSSYRPRLTASGDIGASSGNQGLNAGIDGGLSATADSSLVRNWGGAWRASIALEQPLFDGNRTTSAVAEARAGARAAGGQVQVTEQSVLLEAATVYTNVLREHRIERLRRRNVAALEREVAAAGARDKRGAGTRTDLVQARARRDQAAAELSAAIAETEASVADYARVIGRAPARLSKPASPQALLPTSRTTAIKTALGANPATLTALARASASRHAVDRLNADKLPQIKLRGGLDTDRGLQSNLANRDSASVSVRVVVPLYDGGETTAKVRQARQLNASLEQEARGVRDRVRSGVIAAWARWHASRSRIVSERKALAANREALSGIREGQRLGQRSTLDVLDAQRELVASQIRVAATERDLVVTAFALLAATGQLTRSALDRPSHDHRRAAALPRPTATNWHAATRVMHVSPAASGTAPSAGTPWRAEVHPAPAR